MTQSSVIQRFTWVEGSALNDHDLRGMVSAESAWFAAHIRGLHGTYGIGLGLEAALGSDRRSVLITPGFAVTVTGQPITLAKPVTITAPQARDTQGTEAWDLVVEMAASEAPEKGAPRVRAQVAWKLAGPVNHANPAPGVAKGANAATSALLGRFLLSSERLTGPDYSVRQSASVLERPHVASGRVAGSALRWTVRDERLVATLDLTAGGFSLAPVLHLWIKSHAPWPSGCVGAFASVFDVGRRQAQIQLVAPGAERLQPVADALTLGWLGMEPTRGSPGGFTHADVPVRSGLDSSLWSGALAALQGFHT